MPDVAPVGSVVCQGLALCHRCAVAVPFAVVVLGRKTIIHGDGTREVQVRCGPELADLYAHAWTHEGEATPDEP